LNAGRFIEGAYVKVNYDVFISFKNNDENGGQTKDSAIAVKLYNYLVEKGLSVFFSNVTLEERGKSEYSVAIDEALDTSKCLIVVSCKPEHINAKWIRYEWESFVNDIRSGIKSRAEVFVFYDDMDITDLPRALRLKQSFNASDGNSFERLYNFINNFLSDNNAANENVVMPAGKDDTFSAYDLMLKKLDEMSVFRETYYERECVSHHFRNIMDSDSRYNVFSIDDMVNITPVFYHEIASLLENKKSVLWFANVNEFVKYKNKIDNSINHDKETPLYLFVDYVYSLKEFEDLYHFVQKYSNVTLFTASRIFEEIEECYPKIAFYEIKAMDDDELEKVIESYCRENKYTESASLFDKFRSPLNVNFRNPGFVKIIILGMKQNPSISHDSLTLYKAVESYLKNVTPNSGIFLDTVVEAAIAHKTYRIPLDKLKGFENEILIFSSLGIIENMDNNIFFINTDCFQYLIALHLISSGGENSKSCLSGFLSDCEPFFIKILYDSGGDLLINECKMCQGKEKLVFLFLNDESALKKLYTLKEFHLVMLDIVKYFTETASYDYSAGLLSLFDGNIVSSDEFYKRYCAEKLLLHYWRDGRLCEQTGDIDDSHYMHYIGYIKYCMDKYQEASQYLEKALSMIDESSPYYIQVFLNYVESLMDSGDLHKVKKLLSEIRLRTVSPMNKISLDILRGNLYLHEIDFETAENFYLEALKTAYSIYDKRGLAKANGNLSVLYTYWGKYSEAEKYVMENIKISQKCRDYHGISISHQLYAELLLIQGMYEEAFKHYSYSFFFSKAVNNRWRYLHTLWHINLFANTRQISVSQMESELLNIDSVQYKAQSYLTIALNLTPGGADDNGVQEYLTKAKNYAVDAGDSLLCSVIESVNTFLKGEDGKTPFELKLYCNGFAGLVKTLVDSENGINSAKCPLPFYKFRELTTERLDLVYISENDADDIFDYSSRNLPTRFVTWSKHKKISDTLAFISEIKDKEIEGNLYIWGIRLKSSRKVIGTIEFLFNEKENDIEIGIIISDDYWKMGYAYESLHRIIEFIKTGFDIKRIIGICFTANKASAKMMIKQGFVLKETIPDYHDKPGIQDKSGQKYILLLGD
jgi:ribosomal-protein-alanine N-acetyltransferase